MPFVIPNSLQEEEEAIAIGPEAGQRFSKAVLSTQNVYSTDLLPTITTEKLHAIFQILCNIKTYQKKDVGG